MAGPALADLIPGDESPSGRLPVTWPKAVGQIPIYYNHKNTGRPPQADRMLPLEEIPVGAWQSSLADTSHYLDIGMDPEFPFGFGLTYSSFEYSQLEISPVRMRSGQKVEVSATLTNTGDRTATASAWAARRGCRGPRRCSRHRADSASTRRYRPARA